MMSMVIVIDFTVINPRSRDSELRVSHCTTLGLLWTVSHDVMSFPGDLNELSITRETRSFSEIEII